MRGLAVALLVGCGASSPTFDTEEVLAVEGYAACAEEAPTVYWPRELAEWVAVSFPAPAAPYEVRAVTVGMLRTDAVNGGIACRADAELELSVFVQKGKQPDPFVGDDGLPVWPAGAAATVSGKVGTTGASNPVTWTLDDPLLVEEDGGRIWVGYHAPDPGTEGVQCLAGCEDEAQVPGWQWASGATGGGRMPNHPDVSVTVAY